MTRQCRRSRRVPRLHENELLQGTHRERCPQRRPTPQTPRDFEISPDQGYLLPRGGIECLSNDGGDVVQVHQQLLEWHGSRCDPPAPLITPNHQH